MKPMNPTSMQALCWLAAIILGIGYLVPSPSGAFLAFVLAAFMTAFPAIFGPGKTRLPAAVLLACCIYSAVVKYPEFKSDQERYRQGTKVAQLTATHVSDNGGRARP